MSESSYAAGLVGTPALANLLGTLELLEGYGLHDNPGEPYYDNSGILTIGYGFALTVRNSEGHGP